MLNAYELMKAMIEAGAAGVHFEDQLSSVKKCGHMGGKVLVSTQEAVQKLTAARLAADVMRCADGPHGAYGCRGGDARHHGQRRERQAVPHRRAHTRGLLRERNGIDQAISRGLAYAPYADLIWCETGTPDLGFARAYAEAIQRAIRARCSPTTARRRSTGDATSTARRSRASSTSSARWDTSSSS